MSSKSNASASEQVVLETERAAIIAVRKERFDDIGPAPPLAGVGLSGGGIRSASLSLGVLQALAEYDVLKKFDYISSVSGGGYIAGSLQWWWADVPRQDGNAAQPEFGVGPTDFPYGKARPPWTPPSNPASPPSNPTSTTASSAKRNLEFLRLNSNYLAPGHGLNIGSIIAVLLRTIVISLFIWIPLLTFAFFVLHFGNDAIVAASKTADPSTLLSKFGTFWGACPASPEKQFACFFWYRPIYGAALVIGAALIAFFVIASIVFAFVSRAPQTNEHVVVVFILLLTLAVIYFLFQLYGMFDVFDASALILSIFLWMLLAIIGTLLVSELATSKSLNSSYAMRRTFERFLDPLFYLIIASLGVAAVPLVPWLISSRWGSGTATAMGLAGFVSGVASALYGYYTLVKSIIPSRSSEIAATVGSIIYIYFTLVLAYTLAIVGFTSGVIGGDAEYYAHAAFIGTIVIAAILGVSANINYVGLHRFYRDRLMEAFMPTDKAVDDGRSDFSPVADKLSVAQLRHKQEGKTFPSWPYPLINTNVILVGDSKQKNAARGGDNFLISPLFVGSSATGWQDTEEYIRTKGPLTLASSVAASGAAVTANAGVLGAGLTMNPFVSAVMSLLNIRLGLWVPNPGRKRLTPLFSIPTFIYPGLISGVIARRHSRKSRFIELTDGGHFENLGLYELIRRELPIILIVDAEADPTISLSSFVSAANRVHEDFGARLDFFPGEGPERVVMRDTVGFPDKLRQAKSPYFVAKISYPNAKPGVLIYLKSTVIGKLDFAIAGYLASNPSFPHQPTVNQFFEPDQFDAYRMLGHQAALCMIDELGLNTTTSTPNTILKKFSVITGVNIP